MICGGACRLSAFREDNDFPAPYRLCQDFYDLGYIPEAALESPIEDGSMQNRCGAADILLMP